MGELDITPPVPEVEVETAEDQPTIDPNLLLTPSQRRFLEHARQILKLRLADVTNKEIVQKLNLKPGKVKAVICKLLEAKLIKRRRRGAGQRLSAEARFSRDQIVIQMVKKHATLDEIGEALGGITREGARQVKRNLVKRVGEEIIKSDGPPYTLSEVAKKLGVSGEYILRLCRSGAVTYARRGVEGKGGYLISQDELNRLEQLKVQNQSCPVCGQTFVVDLLTLTGPRKRYCSEGCRRKSQPATLGCFGYRWIRDLSFALKDCLLCEDEKWVTLTEACQLSGLSPMQLTSLRRRQVLTVRPHPTTIHNVTGKPTFQYAVSQLKIAGQIYVAWLEKKRTKKEKKKRRGRKKTNRNQGS